MEASGLVVVGYKVTLRIRMTHFPDPGRSRVLIPLISHGCVLSVLLSFRQNRPRLSLVTSHVVTDFVGGSDYHVPLYARPFAPDSVPVTRLEHSWVEINPLLREWRSPRPSSLEPDPTIHLLISMRPIPIHWSEILVCVARSDRATGARSSGTCRPRTSPDVGTSPFCSP